jgi:hypothetical protein
MCMWVPWRRVMGIWVPYRTGTVHVGSMTKGNGNLGSIPYRLMLTGWGTVSFTRRIQLHEFGTGSGFKIWRPGFNTFVDISTLNIYFLHRLRLFVTFNSKLTHQIQLSVTMDNENHGFVQCLPAYMQIHNLRIAAPHSPWTLITNPQ